MEILVFIGILGFIVYLIFKANNPKMKLKNKKKRVDMNEEITNDNLIEVVKALKKRIKQLENEVDSLEGQVSDLQSQMLNVQDGIDSLESYR